jgi:hypothetical protein
VGTPLDYEPSPENDDHPQLSARDVIVLLVVIVLVAGLYLWFCVARENAANRASQQWELSTRPTAVAPH